MFSAPSKSRESAKIWDLGTPKTSNHIQTKIKMSNPSQETPASSKTPNQDLKDMNVLCTFKVKTSDHIQIKIKMSNLSQGPPASSKTHGEDLKDMDVLWTFKFKIYSK